VDITIADEPIPFSDNVDQVMRSYPQGSEERSGLWNVDFDPSKTILLSDSLMVPPERMRLRNGVSGERREIFAMLEACLRLGRIERAATIIKRALAFLKLDPDEEGRLHNEYLRASLGRILKQPNSENANEMHKWFETMMRSKDVSITAETIAIMLKASLQSRAPRRERLVRRYMDMAPGDIGLEVLSMTDIMTAQDLDTINQIVPEHNILAKLDSIITNDELDMEDSSISGVDPFDSTQTTTDTVPEVRAAEQKGLGLKSLKRALSLFARQPEGFDAKNLSDEEQRTRQERLEQDSIVSAVDRWREENVSLSKMGMDTSLQTKSLGARMWRWQQSLEMHLDEEFINIDKAEATPEKEKTIQDHERCIYGPFLRYLPAEKLAAVTILTTMQIITSFGIDKGVPMTTVIMAIAKNVEDECIMELLRKNMTQQNWKKFNKTASKASGLRNIMSNQHTRRQVTDSLATLVSGKNGEVADPTLKWDKEWSASIKAKIGSCLLAALFETAKMPVSLQNLETLEYITQIQPAFSHTHQYKIGRKTGVLLANPALVTALKREPVHSLLAKHLPMIVPPEPWSKFNQGGFISQPAKVMRIKNGDKIQRYYQEAAIERGDMEQIFKGLEVLGKTSWQVNKPVFDTMLEAWNSGEAIANFPPDEPKFQIPPEPSATLDPAERRRWLRNLKVLENKRSGMHSNRCFMNFQLEIARAFRDEKFYFPHNVDFRGRAYPIPPYLNHMGADHCRGLLKFGEGRELGENGLKWLRIHLANVHGFDKASLSEREQYSIDHMEDIRDSAMNPLTGKKWWLKAEDPWQCLAACHEIKNALECEDPTKFVSHLPVHQDGTCNGLQHYAALGGDEWGAAQVNLEPGDRPADVYSAVADLVKESVAKDKLRGHKAAEWLEGKITRKVVKQTVMTNVYGVTFIGAQAQVKRQLVAAYPDIPSEGSFHAGSVAGYVAQKIFEALGTMFKGAHDIQYWLGECAGRITTSVTPEQLDNLEILLKSPKKEPLARPRINRHQSGLLNAEEQFQFKSSVVWTTPLRMPIVQPYRMTKSRVVTTNLQRISISEPHRSDPVSKRKQLQAFPPNFIHSLDATHMMLSAIKCDEKGLKFASVHDSFWTHACDVDEMNGVLRDAFIQMHSENIIGRLSAEFGARYKNSFYLARISPGSKLYDRVLKWRQESKSGVNENPYRKYLTGAKSQREVQRNMQLAEALLERKRFRLLASEDPAEVAEGKAMVTPISIFEELKAYEDVTGDNDAPIVALGDTNTKRASKSKGEENEEIEEDEESEEIEENDDSESDERDPMESLPFRGNNSTDSFAKHVVEAKQVENKAAAKWKSKLWVWLPLKFPDVPEKVCHLIFLFATGHLLILITGYFRRHSSEEQPVLFLLEKVRRGLRGGVPVTA